MSNNPCILAVDDQVEHLRALQLILEGFGYRVLACDNALEALRLLEHHSIALILADVAMPHMNGYQLLETVRQRSEWVTIPMVFLTARALDSDVRYGKSLGIDDYLTKPVQPEDLLAVVQGKLRRHRELLQSLSRSEPLLEQPGSLELGRLLIQSDRHKAWFAGQPLSLSVREFALLECLARHAGSVVTSLELLSVTHGLQTSDLDEARELIRPLVRSLRQKLDCTPNEPGAIETLRGLGYRMLDSGGC